MLLNSGAMMNACNKHWREDLVRFICSIDMYL